MGREIFRNATARLYTSGMNDVVKSNRHLALAILISLKTFHCIDQGFEEISKVESRIFLFSFFGE